MRGFTEGSESRDSTNGRYSSSPLPTEMPHRAGSPEDIKSEERIPMNFHAITSANVLVSLGAAQPGMRQGDRQRTVSTTSKQMIQ